jgi:hypothetical protein
MPMKLARGPPVDVRGPVDIRGPSVATLAMPAEQPHPSDKRCNLECLAKMEGGEGVRSPPATASLLSFAARRLATTILRRQ